MAAEKTRDNESGWKCGAIPRPACWLFSGLCRAVPGQLLCLRAHSAEVGMANGISWAGRWSPSTQPAPHGLHHPGPTDPRHCTELPHLPGVHIPQNPVRSPLLAPPCHSQLRTGRGQTPAHPVWGVVCPESVLWWERGSEGWSWEHTAGMALGWEQGWKSAQRLAAPPWDGTANSILLRQQRFGGVARDAGVWPVGNSCRDFTGETLKPGSVPATSSQPRREPTLGAWARPPRSSCLWNSGEPEQAPIFLPG